MVYTNHNKNIISFALCALFMTSVVPAQASAITIGTVSRGAALAAILVTVGKFCFTEPTNEDYRFDVDLFMSNPRAWLKTITKKNAAEQAYYVWADGIAGHAKKDAYAKAGKEGSKITFSGTEKIPAKGVGGFISEAVKPVENVFGFIPAYCVFKEKIDKGIEDATNWVMGIKAPAPVKELTLKQEIAKVLAESQYNKEPNKA